MGGHISGCPGGERGAVGSREAAHVGPQTAMGAGDAWRAGFATGRGVGERVVTTYFWGDPLPDRSFRLEGGLQTLRPPGERNLRVRVVMVGVGVYYRNGGGATGLLDR